MKILDKIKQSVITAKENYRAKRKEKLLIKTDDDEFIVESLPAEEDNSGIDIHKVLETMKDPKLKAAVVKNKLKEVIEQNGVRDTLEDLEDEAVVDILEEEKQTLKE